MTARFREFPGWPWVLAACCAALALGMLAAPACKRTAPPGPAIPTTTPEGAAEQTYTVKGVIDRLPSADGKQLLMVHHQALPGFVDAEGKAVGMPEHSMSFPWLAPGLDLSGLREGDAIELTFEVRWKTEPRSLVTNITKLPPGTKLDLMKVVESAGEDPPR